MILKSKIGKFPLVKMSGTQTVIQKFEEKTRETLEKTREGIQNLLDKMRGAKLGLGEPEEEAE